MRGGCGMACIAMRWWSFWPTVFWCCCVPASMLAGADRPGFFPQCHWAQTLPATRRRVLEWLAVDVLLWLVRTNQLPHLQQWRTQHLQC